MNITFVIPVFNEAPTLAALAAGIEEHAAPWPHRILFIDDGSTDATPEILRKLHEGGGVDFIRMRRNFGKTRALALGFARAGGDVIVTMDGDLQDRPEEIPKLIAKYEEGYGLVCGWKAERQDAGHKVALSHVYNACLSRLFGLGLHDVNTGFKAIRTDLARRLPMFGDMHRMMAVFAARAGYRVGEVAVDHAPREHGTSKYGLWRYHRGAMDAGLAWMLTRGRGTAALRHAALGTSLALLPLGALCLALGGGLEGGLAGLCCLAAGGMLAFVSGGLLVLSRWVLPLGEYVEYSMADEHAGEDLAEEAVG